MKKRYVCVYVLFVALFIAYLFSANSLIEKILVSKDESVYAVEEFDGELNLSDSNEAVTFLYNFNNANDLYSSVTMKGYIDIPEIKEAKKNDEAYTELIFFGNKKKYHVDTIQCYRGEDRNLKSGYYEFKTIFSTLGMKDGVYEVYVYDHIDKSNEFIVNTHTFIEKNGDGFAEYVPPKIDNVSYEYDNSVAVHFYAKTNCNDGKYYKLTGIARNMDYDSADEKVYLEFTFDDGHVETYDTMVSNSWWTCVNYEKKYQKSDFYAKIPTKILNGKHVKMRILVDNNGIYAYNKTFHLSFDDLGYRIMAPEEIYVGKVKNFGIFETDICVTGEMTNAFFENDSKDAYIFEGTSYVEGLISQNSKVYIEFNFADGTLATYPAELSVNNEIAGDYSNSAFRAEIVKSAFGKQDVSVYLLIENAEKIYRSQNAAEYVYSDGVFVKK